MASTPARALKTAARTVPARSRSKAAAAAPQATHAPFAAREPVPRFSLDDRAVAGTQILVYHPTKGVDDFVQQLAVATPLQMVATERHGVAGGLLKDLSRRMEIPAARMFTILGVPKATAEKKSAAGDVVSGSGGQAALGMARLLGMAQEMLAQSTAPEAEGFDSAKWLGQWLERPQPALGGRKPADLLDTPTGLKVVTRLLGAIHSGAYQ